jgi:hypothetical protein
MYTREQTQVRTTSRIQHASLRGQIRHIDPSLYVSDAQGQMNLLFRSLYILFLPRLPRFGPEDVASTAEYYNRLARLHEETRNPPDMWRGRISMHLAVPILSFKSKEKIPQRNLRRAA